MIFTESLYCPGMSDGRVIFTSLETLSAGMVNGKEGGGNITQIPFKAPQACAPGKNLLQVVDDAE